MSTNTFLRTILTIAVAFPIAVSAQIEVNREKYPDYSNVINPDMSLMQKTAAQKSAARNAEARGTRPAYVNNADQKFFPPVFNQDGGSCGSASRICYMFTYELNAYRNLDGKRSENYYPSHFVWLLTNSSSGKNEFVTSIGVPSAATYGGQTYSSKFGNQDCSDNNFGWMQGYEKWFEAMHNRMLAPVNTPLNVGTKEGRELVKNWLWNHNGDTEFKAGGICGIGVASANGNYDATIPSTTANSNAGVVGKKYVKAWGTQVDHALTIVGYDDRIEFDLDGNGVAGESSKDEVGAWIIVNSWGSTWGNNGFIYCPYAYGGATFNSNGTFSENWWQPELYKVRKDYRPLRTIKLEMNYSRRSEIKLSVGISSDINSDIPEKIIEFEHFKYAGDGNYGNTQPAPEVPMLGKWADGKMHTEPMEFGYDLTDLTKGYDRSMPLKYFFIVETRDWAAGNGNIHSASIMDYELNADGIETPFLLTNGKQEIKNAGNKTIISTVVYGEPYYAPQNPFINNNTLQWSAPLPSTNSITKYNIYHNDEIIAEVAANALTYDIPSSVNKEGIFGVSAVYEGGVETEKASAAAPIPYESTNKTVYLNTSGIRLPDIFNEKYNEATIEYYIRPNSLKSYNQVIGPGWGAFMVHAEANGRLTAGWNTTTNDRFTTSSSILSVGKWTHIALVINKNKMTVYANGVEKGSCTSSTYSGIGGFGDLLLRAENDIYNTNNDARYDEIRIWNKARTANEIQESYKSQYSGTIRPKGLVAYYKGDIITVDGKKVLHEYISNKHGEFLNDSYSNITSSDLTLNGSTSPSVDIKSINGNVYAGTPVRLSATHSSSISNLKWSIEAAGITNLTVLEPLVIFKSAGNHKIKVVAEDNSGKSVSDEMTIYVYPEQEIDATFTASKSDIIMGEKISFIIKNPSFGEMYEWNITGAEESIIYGQHGYAVFKEPGKQTVTLKVTSLSGEKTATSSIEVYVAGTAPVADFDITPAVVMKGERVYLKDKSKYTPTKWLWTIKSDSAQYVIAEKNGSFVPKRSGIYKTTLEVSNNIGSNSTTHDRAIIVCNADSRNGLNFSGRENAKVTASTNGFSGQSSTLTVEWWMCPDELYSNCLGIGENESTFLIKTDVDGRVNVFVGGKKLQSFSKYVIPNEWHHYAVILENEYISLYCDGKYFQRDYLNAKIPSLNSFSIGNDNAKMHGQIDEFRIWTSIVKNDALTNVCNIPIENPEIHKDLVLYYDFNQSGGDVIDRSSYGNNGVRSGFGPDGDAWGLSKGVFCLSFGDETTKEDVTSVYLKNYCAEFEYDSGNLVNTTVNNRFYALTGWTIENAVTNGRITTGAHVDAQKDYFMTFTTDWDGFGSLKNHKTYQTVTLPAGKYRFIAKYYDKWEGQSGNSYLVAAKGTGLPDTENVASSIAYTKMKEYDHETVFSNEIEFILEKRTEVSLGLIVNMNVKQCLTIKEFVLEWEEIEGVDEEEDMTVIENIETENKNEDIYNLHGIRVVNPRQGDIYIRNGKKFIYSNLYK